MSDISNQEVHCIQADLSDCMKLPNVAEEVANIWPEIDILVNNAGIGIFSAFENVSLNELDSLINLNIKTPYLFSQYLMKSLEKRNGNIINISSYFSHRMIPGRTSTAYSLTKGALDSFTKSLAFEVGSKGVRVNAIAPGTGIGEPEDIGGAAVYLASDMAKWVTGAIFNIDGGLTTN